MSVPNQSPKYCRNIQMNLIDIRGSVDKMDLSRFAIVIITSLTLVCSTGGNQSPQWNNFPSTLLVSEDASIGSVVTVLNATDPEDEQLTYKIKGGLGGEVLAINVLNTSEVAVIVAKAIDREAVEEYSLLFTVSDGVNVVQRWCQLYILDINDNRPRFLDLPYYTKLPEDTKVGSAIYRVSAEDPDTGVWSLVSYAMKTRTDYFDINTARGTVILSKALHYGIQRYFQLEILAIDGGGLASSVTLEVDIIQTSSQNTSKGMRCYSCVHGQDCNMRQLSYSPAVNCPPGHLCYVSSLEDPWGDFRYRRGCQEVSKCGGIQEKCWKTDYGRYKCNRCCDQVGCNGNLSGPHLLRDAWALIQNRDPVAYNRAKSQWTSFNKTFFILRIVLMLCAF